MNEYPVSQRRAVPHTRMRIRCILPGPGEILVDVGQDVQAGQIVAHWMGSGTQKTHIVDVARCLGLAADENLSGIMAKRQGDSVEIGETLATWRGLLPFVYKPCRAPVAGRLARITQTWAVIEAQAQPDDLAAPIAGSVIGVEPGRSLTLATRGMWMEAACGFGQMARGRLHLAAAGPDVRLEPDELDQNLAGTVVVGGMCASRQLLERAGQIGVNGMIVGSISASLVETAQSLPFPILISDGFGCMPLNERFFSLLQQSEGREAVLVPDTGRNWPGPVREPEIRWELRPDGCRTTRPAVLIPDLRPDKEAAAPEERASELSGNRSLQPGDTVRILRGPWTGALAEVTDLGVQPAQAPSGLKVDMIRVLVSPQSAQGQSVPRLNVERIG